MTDLASNPIYMRMIEGSRGPSARVCQLIVVLVGIVVGVFYLWSIKIAIFGSGAGYLFFIPLVLMLLQPLLMFVAMTVTAQRTARLVSNEDFALVRISGLAETEIARGYTGGARYRFRLLTAISAGFLAAFYITIVASLPMVSVYFSTNGVFNIEELVKATIAAFTQPSFYAIVVVIVATLYSAYQIVWPLALTAGVWAALRSPRNAAMIAGGLVLIPIAYVPIALFLLYRTLSITGAVWVEIIAFCVMYGFLALATPDAILYALRADCVRLVSVR